jgi:hypothetical protein
MSLAGKSMSECLEVMRGNAKKSRSDLIAEVEAGHDYTKAMLAERDALIVRVKELEGALKEAIYTRVVSWRERDEDADDMSDDMIASLDFYAKRWVAALKKEKP